jgi:hypothetical protein
MSVGAAVQLVYSVSVWWSPDITALCISLDVDELLVSKNRQTLFVPLLQALEIKPISYYYSPSPRLIPFNNFSFSSHGLWGMHACKCILACLHKLRRPTPQCVEKKVTQVRFALGYCVLTCI